MNLFDRAKKFEQLSNAHANHYDFAKSLTLAEKFEKKFSKTAQQTEMNEANKARNQILKEISTHLQRNPNLNAGQAAESLWNAEKPMYLQELISVVENVASALMRGNEANKQFASNTLIPSIDSLRKLLSERPSIPTPSNGTTTEAPAVPSTPTKSKYTPIPKDIQTKLNKLLAQPEDMSMLPIKEDGILGPETMSALKTFKTKYNLGNLPLPQLLQRVREHELPTV